MRHHSYWFCATLKVCRPSWMSILIGFLCFLNHFIDLVEIFRKNHENTITTTLSKKVIMQWHCDIPSATLLVCILGTHNFRGHKSIVHKVRFHPKKLEVVSVSDDFEVRVWNLNTNKYKKRFSLILCAQNRHFRH